MASTSRTTTHVSASTSEESFSPYQPPFTRLPFRNNKRYHVFLSFRGPDVRKTLVDHLFEALSVAGLNVFLDSDKLEKGELIDESLERAIESSAIRIPIFSRGYAESTWCLREAAEMLRTPSLIIPLFYHVEPTHVRYPEKEKSPYYQSFQKHRDHSNRYKKEEIDRWKNALLEICKRSGWSMDLTDGFEARMIKRVVNDLIKTLDRVPLPVAEHPVGLENVKKFLIHKLNLKVVDDVTKIGIWGIGGIGKTTVAKAVYNQLYADFEASSFVSDVRTTAAETSGLTKLQKKILKDLCKYDKEVDSVDEGIALLRDRLGGKRVLLVLDDVDAVKQLYVLAGDWLSCGSRIIITSRDKHIFSAGGNPAQCIHEMSGLGMEESLQLFSWHAFLRASPSLGYKDLSRRIVEACKGHPLSLEVIGSLLYDKKDEKDCWKEALHDITHNSEIYDILYISYNALSDEEKEIFVDIACFFIGEDKTLPIVFWESLFNKAHTAVSNLSMKLLIKFDDDGLFQMHDHLRDMGQIIAEKEKQGTRKWKPTHLSTISNNLSRLQIIGGNPQSLEMLYTDGLHYLHLESLTIECMSRDALLMLLPLSLKWLRLKNCKFEVVKNLKVKKPPHSRIVDNIWQCKILQLNGCFDVDSSCCFDVERSCVFTLISLSLSLPRPIPLVMLLLDSIGNLSQLQSLDLAGCVRLSSLPNGIGNLSQLQSLDLEGCVRLSSLPNGIGNLSQLQSLDLGECVSLSSLPERIGNLSQLQSLDLGWCESLSSLPEGIGNLSQLQSLDLGWCGSLSSLPKCIGNLSQLQSLDLGGCRSLSSLPEEIGNLSQLQSLHLGECGSLSSLPEEIGNLSQLQSLHLGECGSLSSLPEGIGNLSHLRSLHLGECGSLSSLPEGIGNLSQLRSLHLGECGSLSSLPEGIGNLSQLQSLHLGECRSLSSLPEGIGNLSQLPSLDLRGCGSLSSLPEGIGNLSQLPSLDLRGCGSLSSLPEGIGNLSQLQSLDLGGCGSLSSLPEGIGNLSQLQSLDLGGCGSLSSLPEGIGNLSQLQILHLGGCGSLSSLPEGIGNLSQLQILHLGGCGSLSSLLEGIGNLSQLQILDLGGGGSLSSLPEGIGNLSQLRVLHLGGWGSLSSLPEGIGNLSQLQGLHLGGCGSLSSLPEGIGNLSQLQGLNLEGCGSLSSLTEGIGNLSQLQSLNLGGCGRLSCLPDGIGNLSQLQSLYLGECGSLSSLPNSIGNLSQLQHLDLGWCGSLSSLPNSLVNLSQLQSLNLEGCGNLLKSPNSIGILSQL